MRRLGRLSVLEWRGELAQLCRRASDYLKTNGAALNVDKQRQLLSMLLLNGLCNMRRFSQARRVLAEQNTEELKAALATEIERREHPPSNTTSQEDNGEIGELWVIGSL